MYDQLHIHVCLVKDGVQEALKNVDGTMATSPAGWKNSPVTIDNVKGYRVFRLDADSELTTRNLFHDLWHYVLSENNAAMQNQNLVVVKRPTQAQGGPKSSNGGFYVVNSDFGAGVDLLTNCK